MWKCPQALAIVAASVVSCSAATQDLRTVSTVQPTTASPPPAAVRTQPASPNTVVAEPGVPAVPTLLDMITVLPELAEAPGYERSCKKDKGCVFGPAWTDTEHTGCDTRNRILGEQLVDVVFKAGTHDCKVISGILHDPYSGSTIAFTTGGPSEVEIDHVYALARAWDAGAAHWTDEQRVQFANDTDNLLAVSKSANSAKSDSGPGDWMPDNPLFRCHFVHRYLSVAAKYQLAITEDDRAASMAACVGEPSR